MTTDRPGLRGILAPAAPLDRWLLVVLVVLAATCSVRYVDRHGVGTTGLLVLLGAAALVVAYATRQRFRPTAWVIAMVLIWAALTAVAPSFAWCALPVVFAVLQVLPFAVAVGTTVFMTLLVTASTWRILDEPDPTLVAGPVGIALVTVIAYRALEREAHARQALLEDLTAAQAELAAEQHRSGALAERTRLSREIHDSVGQGLSSINLLLQAAEQDWTRQPASAREHVRTAASTARAGLDEVRRVVRDLAPAGIGDPSGLADALAGVAGEPGLKVELHIEGEPVPVSAQVGEALVRTARGALANVREHAAASRAAVTLTYLADEVLLDVRDDGRGYVAGQLSANPLRGRGLAGIRERATRLGGRAEFESTPGEGSTVSVAFPLQEDR